MVQIPDLLADPAAAPMLAKFAAARTILAAPILKDSEVIGVIIIYRQEVRPFTDKQIELVQNFARRPSSPSRTPACSTSCASRCSSRLRHPRCCVISSSPGELKRVFETMLENATRICGAKFGNFLLCDGNAFRSLRCTKVRLSGRNCEGAVVHPWPKNPLVAS